MKLKAVLGKVVAVLSWGYLLFVGVLILAIQLKGDRDWQGTLLLFSPRWVAVLPLVVLGPLAILLNRRTCIVLSIAAFCAVFPLMRFHIGWRRFWHPSTAGLPIRIVAFNVHHGYLREPAVAQFLNAVHPDVVALEELPLTFDHSLFPRGQWQMVQHDELCLASRYPIVSVKDLWANVATRYVLKTPAGPVDFVVVHLSSPHFALRDAVTGMDQGSQELALNIRYRTQEATMLGRLADSDRRPLILAGDFNLLPDSPLFSGPFRSMSDSFETTGIGFGYTYSNQWTTVRIDHVLCNSFFENTAFSRGPSLGSPHFPIVADVILKAK